MCISAFTSHPVTDSVFKLLKLSNLKKNYRVWTSFEINLQIIQQDSRLFHLYDEN